MAVRREILADVIVQLGCWPTTNGSHFDLNSASMGFVNIGGVLRQIREGNTKLKSGERT